MTIRKPRRNNHSKRRCFKLNFSLHTGYIIYVLLGLSIILPQVGIVFQQINSNCFQCIYSPDGILRFVAIIQGTKEIPYEPIVPILFNGFTSLSHQIELIVNIVDCKKMSTSYKLASPRTRTNLSLYKQDDRLTILSLPIRPGDNMDNHTPCLWVQSPLHIFCFVN